MILERRNFISEKWNLFYIYNDGNVMIVLIEAKTCNKTCFDKISRKIILKICHDYYSWQKFTKMVFISKKKANFYSKKMVDILKRYIALHRIKYFKQDLPK